uniref:BAG domain-containing protein n=1 Tax=Callorhinchus milii TaxID=7868 RepID=A0A4W3HBR9_CALMI
MEFSVGFGDSSSPHLCAMTCSAFPTSAMSPGSNTVSHRRPPNLHTRLHYIEARLRKLTAYRPHQLLPPTADHSSEGGRVAEGTVLQPMSSPAPGSASLSPPSSLNSTGFPSHRGYSSRSWSSPSKPSMVSLPPISPTSSPPTMLLAPSAQRACFTIVRLQPTAYVPGPQLNHLPNPGPGSGAGQRVEYSAPPEMYKIQGGKRADRGPGMEVPEPAHPGHLKVERILCNVRELDMEVERFEGKRGDKRYRLLEELLTKQLLEADSVETNGEESVRQARKEAVHRIQGTLERLERIAC